MGFGPQLVDLDCDGLEDVISGNWIHQIVWFRRGKDGTFAAGQPLKDKDGKVLRVDYGVYASAVDWDSDGDLDLLAGTVDRSDAGNVYLIRNYGAAGSNAFGKPEKLVANEKPIVAHEGDAAPVAADWDNDGKLDLVLGCGDGSVLWYRNVGTNKMPTFSSFETLISPPKLDVDRGTRAKPCVVDWNEDGLLDLIVGDFGKPFDKVLSEDEKQWRDEARRQQSDFLKSWARVFREYRQLLAKSPAEAVPSEELKLELSSARSELVRLNIVRSRYREQEQALQPGKQYHGRVWVYLRDNSKLDDNRIAKSDYTIRDNIVIDEPTANRPVVIASSLYPRTTTPGKEVTLAIRMKVAENWHVYAVDTKGKTGLATELSVELPAGLEAKGDWVLPYSEKHISEIPISIYEGDIVFRRRLTISPKATLGPIEIKCRVTYQACDDKLCLPPKTTTLSTSLRVKAE